jgi:hypothetical protein
MTALHVPAGEGPHHQMIDGDHVAKAAVHDAAGAFEVVGDTARFVAITSGNGAGRFFEDFANSVAVDRPMEESMGAILSVTQHHGVSLAGA